MRSTEVKGVLGDVLDVLMDLEAEILSESRFLNAAHAHIGFWS